MKKIIYYFAISSFLFLISPSGLFAQTTNDKPLIDNNLGSSVAEVFDVKGVEGTLVVSNPYISGGSLYCGSGISLSANPYSASYTYQWSFSTTETGTYANISGATTYFFATTASNNIGYYKVSINDGTTPVLSPSFRVRQGGSATLVSATPSISAGQSTTLNLTFTGTAPWVIKLTENLSNNGRDYVFSTTSGTIPITPDSYKYFQISNLFDGFGVGCSTNGSNGTTTITVNPTPTIGIGTPTNTSVCAGNIIDIPLTLNGTWGDSNYLSLAAYLTSNGTYVAFITAQIINSTIRLFIPPTIPIGNYGLELRLVKGYTILTTSTSSYNISIINSGCSVSKPLIIGKAIGCIPILNASPQGSSYTYQWFKNNIAISGATSAFYSITDNQIADYKVTVTNTGIGYSGTSDVISGKNIINPVSISTLSNNLCGGNVNLSSSYTGVGFSYQWYKAEISNVTTTRTPMFGEIGSTLGVTAQGAYQVSVWDGNCQTTSSYQNITACPPTISSANPIICGANTQAVMQSSTNTANIYQWSSSPSSFGTFTNISGATGSSYTATTTGYYKVTNDVGTLSNAFWINSAPYAVLLNPNGNTNPINITAGGTAAITYVLYGTAPFSFTSTDNVNSKIILSPTNQITLSHNTPSSRFYSVNSLTGAGCTISGNGQNSILVNVGTPTLTVGAIASTICAGDVISVPYTLGGTYDSNINIFAQIYNASTNAYVTGNSGSTNPLQVQIPTTLPAGTYYLSLYGNLPYINVSNTTKTSTFIVTAACMPTVQASIHGYSSVCNGTNLSAFPNGTGYNFVWRRNGSVVFSSTSSSYYASESGNYTVVITNTSNGYNSTSAIKTLTINSVIPIINTPNASLCGTNTTVTLSTPLTGAGYTYLWQKNISGFRTIVGQTTSTLTLTQTSDAGQYRVIVNDGSCDNISSNISVSTSTTARLLNSSGNTNPANINVGQAENLQLQMSGQSPFIYNYNSTDITTNSSTVTLPVSPSVSTTYNVLNVRSNGSACSTSSFYPNSILVNVLVNPCLSIRNLVSTTDDYSSGTTVKEANSTTGTITATNKITGTANVIYRAGKSIILEAGFKADNGTVFKTEFGGCN